MAFKLHSVVPWGRSFGEYVDMFSLSGEDLDGHILGCGDGPSSFNTELTKRGGHIISVDPLYQFSADEIQGRIDDVAPVITQQLNQNKESFIWERFASPEDLKEKRVATMETFLADYNEGLDQGRYLEGSLPSLPFGDKSFSLALCSHLLFLYSEHFSLEFHIESILELCRVAKEVRIFPLLELSGQQSRYLDDVASYIIKRGGTFEFQTVNYEFQKGGHQMARVTMADKLMFFQIDKVSINLIVSL